MELITIFLMGLFTSSSLTVLEPNMISIEDFWLEQFKDTEYIYGKYDCTQFSNDFNAMLYDKGVNSTIIMGFYYSERLSYGRGLHCWLDIDGRYFEPTIGRFTNSGRYEPVREVRRCP